MQNSATPPAVKALPGSALSLLGAHHARLEQVFNDYALLCTATQASDADRRLVIAGLGAALVPLIRLKEELFYPLLGTRVDAAELQAARADHQRIEAQWRVVAGLANDSSALDRGMSQLGEMTRAHIAFEVNRLWPHVEALDAPWLCDRMATRLAELRDGQGQD